MPFGADVWALVALPVWVLMIPWQCSLVAPPLDRGPVEVSAASPKTEETGERVPTTPVAPPEVAVRPAALAEEVVVKAMDAGQPLFLRCWQRAQRKEIGPIGGKVRLQLEIDDQGHVAAARSDTESAVLASCLAVVARQLPFPAPGRPAVVDLPLMFR
jgi:hypothetical protein